MEVFGRGLTGEGIAIHLLVNLHEVGTADQTNGHLKWVGGWCG